MDQIRSGTEQEFINLKEIMTNIKLLNDTKTYKIMQQKSFSLVFTQIVKFT